MPSVDRTTLATGRQRTVLRLVCDGVERFYADDALSFTDSTPGSTGEVVTVAGMAEPDIADQLGDEGDALAVELLDPASHADLIAGLDGAWAEVAQIVEGQDWTARRVLLRGYADAPVYGTADEPIRFGLASAPWEDRGLLPLPTWQTGPETWPRATSGLVCPEELHGLFYPVVIGDPGSDRDATTEADWFPLPALIVEIDDSIDPPDNSAAACVVLLGAGVLACVGASVEVFNETATAGGAAVSCVVSPFVASDLMGQVVTCVEIAAGDMPVVIGDALWWRSENVGEPVGISRTSRAGEAIRWMLSFSSAEVDADLLRDAADRLDRWRVGFFLNEPVSPYRYIQDHFFPILPVLPIDGPAGFGLAVLPTQPADADGLEEIDVDAAGGARSGPVERSSWREVSTSLAMEYAQDIRLGAYRRRIDLDPTITRPVGSRQPTPYGAAMSLRYPGLRLLSLDSEIVCDALTATALAEYQIRRASQTSDEVEIALPQSYQYLQSGDLVRLTVADIGWSAVLCVTLSVPRISGMGVFRFRTVPDWARVQA